MLKFSRIQLDNELFCENEMIMGIFRREPVNKGVADLSRTRYQQCFAHRRQLLDSFRHNAITEHSFKYPGAQILVNRLYSDFMVLRKNDGVLDHGMFADYESPFLHYVPDDANAIERMAVVTAYEQDVQQACGVLRRDSAHIPNFRLRERDSFKEEGHKIWHTTEINNLWGGALFLDGKQIAKSTVLEPKPANYFSTKLYDYVFRRVNDTPTGHSSLVLVLGELNFCSPSDAYRYEISFPNKLDLLSPQGDPQIKGAILALRDFLSNIEDVLVEPQVDEENKVEFLFDRDKALFDSPGDPSNRSSS